MDFRIKTIFDSGTAKFIEDRVVMEPPFLGVLDGVSGLYDPSIGPQLFLGKTGGQKATQIVEEVFMLANKDDELITVVKEANTRLRNFSKSVGIDIDRADLLPGMAFAFAKIGDREVEIIQGGDSFVLWENTNGEIGLTANQNFFDDEEKVKILNDIIIKCNGDMNKAWPQYIPLSSRLRIERVNKNLEKKSVVLNGQAEGESLWFKKSLKRKGLKTVILFTDGMIEFSESRDPVQISKTILDVYHRLGIDGILFRIREIESKRTTATHIKNAEATVLLIEF